MKGRYPRTIAEFGAHQRQVWVGCGPCNRRRLVANDVLEAMFGPDFDRLVMIAFISLSGGMALIRLIIGLAIAG